MNLSNSGSLFDLQASLSIDTSAYSAAVQDAISEAGELQSAIDSADGGEIKLSASVSGTEDVDGLNSSISGVGSSAETSQTSVNSLQDKIVNGLAGIVTISAIGKLASSIAGLAGDFTKAGDRIDKSSQQLSISKKAYQEWDYILRQNGMDISNLTRGMNTLRQGLSDPNDTFSEAIKNLGLNIGALQEMSTEDAFSEIITGLQGIEDPEKKAALAMKLFGNQMGSQLLPLLNQSAANTDKLRQKAHDLGLVMSDEAVGSAVAYTDAMDSLNSAWNALKYQLIGGVMPAFTIAINGLTALIGKFTGEDTSLTANVDKVTTTFTKAVETINGQELNATSILNAMEALGDPEAFTDQQAAMWDAYYTKLTEVIPGIKEQFGTQVEATAGATQALREHAQSLLDDAKAAAVAQAIASRQDALTEAYSKQTTALVEYTVAKNNAEGIYNSAAYQSYLQRGAAYDAEWGGVDSFIAPALNYTTAETNAMLAYNQALTQAAEAQKNYEIITGQTAEAEASTNAWINALYEVAGIDPGRLTTPAVEAAETYSETLDSMVADTKEAAGEMNAALATIGGTWQGSLNYQPGSVDGSHADGLDYVPRDGYIAELHKGEMVLTAGQAQDYRTGGWLAAIEALANRPIAFSVGDTALATSIAGASSRANALRSATIASGYGRGLV